MTTEELAKIIGVSRVTLSKVINGNGGVSKKTEEKIRRYIEEYNFEPNSKARSLVGKEEQIIGLISAYSGSYSGASKNIPSHFATELINLAVNSAQERGYKTLVCLTDVEKDVRSIERLFSSKLICGKCGSIYGPKPWHSTSYNNLVWQCRRRQGPSSALPCPPAGHTAGGRPSPGPVPPKG